MKCCALLMVVLLAACSRPTTPSVDLLHPAARFEPVVNLPWWHYRQDFGDMQGWQPRSLSHNRQEAAAGLRELKLAGVSTVVWFLLADGAAALEFDADDNIAGLNATFLTSYRAALQIAAEQNISIVWVLMDHLWAKPAQFENRATLFGHAKSLQHPQQFIERVLNPILAIDSPAIAAWIVMNEPEVVLQEGWVSENTLMPFLEAASNQIKRKQPHKPVSIGHADFESMIYFQQMYPAIPQDFLIFHHYKAYLPPRAPNLGKPIYIGEFNLNEQALPRPSQDWATLVGWVQQLGYAGLWPWAATQKDKLQLADIANFTNALGAPATKPLRDDRHAIHVQIELWKQSIARNRAEIAVNTNKLADTLPLLQSESAGMEKDQADLNKALQAHQKLIADLFESTGKLRWMRWLPFGGQSLALEQSNNQQLQSRLTSARQWVAQAEVNAQRRRQQLAEQQQWKSIYETRIRGNQYQLQKTEAILSRH